MAVTAIKNTKSNIDSVREIVQDFLVPELKALKVEIASVRNEMATGLESVRSEVSSVRTEMGTGFESLRTEMRLRDEKQTQAIQALSDRLTESTRFLSEKIDNSVEVRQRLAALEARPVRA